MKMLINLLLVACLSSAAEIKCDSEPGMPCIDLWNGNTPQGPAPSKPIGNESRTSDDGPGCGPNRDILCDHINHVSDPTLTPFLVNNGTGAAIIIAPGGGYHDLAWTKEGLDYAHFYNSIGVSAFVLKYRVPSARPHDPDLPKWFAPLQDAQRAIGIVRANASKWGLNASRIGFTGSSAGGHLTAHISTAWHQRYYSRVDGADDVSCRPDFSVMMYPWDLLPNNKAPVWGETYSLATELSNVTKDHPPTAFIHNTDDGAAPVQGSLVYAGKLLSVKAETPSVHLFNKGGHGFGLCQGKTKWLEVCDWPKAVQRFLQDHGMTVGWPDEKSAAAWPKQMLTQNCAK